MRNLKRLGFKRIAAGVMALAMLLIVLLSAGFIALESEHDCAGDDCLICACLKQCRDLLDGIGICVRVCLRTAACAACLYAFIGALRRAFACETPVSMKIRLNN